MKKIFYLTLLVLAGCALINPQEQEHHAQKQKLRHGIVVVEVEGDVSAHYVENLDPKSVERGRKIYRNDCMQCHGVDGRGNGPEASMQNPRPSNLRETVRAVPSFDFHMSISQWKGEMPGWKNPYGLDELKDLATYLKSFR